MNVLDLFSGIGGFSLGLERAGMRTIAFCEINLFCRDLLARHWPGVPCYEDVRDLTAGHIAADVVCGGFPCQDVSQAGSRRGLSGTRSGLWFEFLRIIRECRPLFVIIENVPRLRAHGLETVLRGLAEIRYDAEWHCIPAARLGAPDIRDRLWVIAYPQHTDADCERSHQAPLHEQGSPELRYKQVRFARPILSSLPGCGERLESGTIGRWNPEPRIRRVAPRTTENVDRIKALGNAVKPIIPEIIGRAIMKQYVDVVGTAPPPK